MQVLLSSVVIWEQKDYGIGIWNWKVTLTLSYI